MKERSVFSYWWFWLLIVGILLILLAAILHLGFKENTRWAWWIFAAGALLAILGIIFAFVSYFNEPRCVPVEAETKEENACSNFMDRSKIVISDTKTSPIHSPIGEPSRSTLNLPQAQRGFTATGMDISSLAPAQNV